MSAIFERRSIRKYEDKPVPDEMIETLLRAGMAAPSATDERPWQFIVIKDKNTLTKLAEVHPYGKMLPYCSVAIVVCADLSRDKNNGLFWSMDCSAATENILLCVTELKLGAVWLAIYPKEERMKQYYELLGLPDHIVPFATIPLGYPAEERKQRDCFEPERIHYEVY